MRARARTMEWDKKSENWGEFKRLWASSDAETRLLYLMRRSALREFLQEERALRFFYLWQDPNNRPKLLQRNLIISFITCIISSFCAFISDYNLISAIFGSIFVFSFLTYMRLLCQKVILFIDEYYFRTRKFFHNERISDISSFDDELDFLKGIDIESLNYILINKFKIGSEEEEKYRKCVEYYQKVHLDILRSSNLSDPPYIFP